MIVLFYLASAGKGELVALLTVCDSSGIVLFYLASAGKRELVALLAVYDSSVLSSLSWEEKASRLSGCP